MNIILENKNKLDFLVLEKSDMSRRIRGYGLSHSLFLDFFDDNSLVMSYTCDRHFLMNGDIEDFTRENKEMFLGFFEHFEDLTIGDLCELFFEKGINFKKEKEVSDTEGELRLLMGHRVESIRLTEGGVEYVNFYDTFTAKRLGELLVADVKKSRLIDRNSDVVKRILQIPKVKANDAKHLLVGEGMYMGYLSDNIYRFNNEGNEMYLIIE